MAAEKAKSLFDGVWKEHNSENQEEVFKEMGFNFMLRKLASSARPEITMEFNGDDITVTMKISLKSQITKLKIGETVEISNDTEKFMCKCFMDGDELITEQTPVIEGKKKLTIRRKIVDGDMIMSYELREHNVPFDGPVAIHAKRYLSKVVKK